LGSPHADGCVARCPPSSPALWNTLFERSCYVAGRAVALGFTHRVPATRQPSWLDAYAASATGSSE